jgi:hypothetical protein
VSPSDILAAARQNVVGPYLPARREWLRGWAGPVQFLCRPGDTSPNDSLDGWEDASTCTGSHLRHPDGGRLVAVADVVDRIRLDVNRPEVRDHLVRLGCPEWGRDVPAAVWAWGAGVEVSDVITPWSDASDLAALNAGCILRVEGGWLVPLPGGGVGFFLEVSRDE